MDLTWCFNNHFEEQKYKFYQGTFAQMCSQMREDGRTLLSLDALIENFFHLAMRTEKWKDSFLLSSTIVGYDGKDSWIGEMNPYEYTFEHVGWAFKWTPNMVWKQKLDDSTQEHIFSYLQDKNPLLAYKRKKFKLDDISLFNERQIPGLHPSVNNLYDYFHNGTTSRISLGQPFFSFLVMTGCMQDKGQLFRLHRNGDVRDGMLGIFPERYRVSAPSTPVAF